MTKYKIRVPYGEVGESEGGPIQVMEGTLHGVFLGKVEIKLPSPITIAKDDTVELFLDPDVLEVTVETES